jgi:hypothetical protein
MNNKVIKIFGVKSVLVTVTRITVENDLTQSSTVESIKKFKEYVYVFKKCAN